MSSHFKNKIVNVSSWKLKSRVRRWGTHINTRMHTGIIKFHVSDLLDVLILLRLLSCFGYCFKFWNSFNSNMYCFLRVSNWNLTLCRFKNVFSFWNLFMKRLECSKMTFTQFCTHIRNLKLSVRSHKLLQGNILQNKLFNLFSTKLQKCIDM